MSSKTAEFDRLSSFFSSLALGEYHSLSQESTNTLYGDAVSTTSSETSIESSQEGKEGWEENAAETQGAALEAVMNSISDLAGFAKTIAAVLTESQSKFQPLPESLCGGRRGSEVSILSVMSEAETTSRVPKKLRKTGSSNPVAEEDDEEGCVAGQTFTKTLPPRRVAGTGRQDRWPRALGRGRQRTVSSIKAIGGSIPVDHPFTYDEQAVLDFVRELCEKKNALRRRPPPLSPESDRTTFAAEDSAADADRRKNKRRLSS